MWSSMRTLRTAGQILRIRFAGALPGGMSVLSSGRAEEYAGKQEEKR